ncbi:hypothetical protein [Streptomyces niveus]|uniref:hypothetical protein n=1 Tax=Streptomyces niveus TaxID=193462 RepID=UPI0033E5E541
MTDVHEPFPDSHLLFRAECRLGQAIHLSRPTVDWPDGRPVVTVDPGLYADMPLVRTIRLPKQR